MSARRRVSYRLLVARSALGRLARALGYYVVAGRAQLRTWRSAYHVQMFGYRIRAALAASGRFVGRIPRRVLAGLALVAWFVKELPAYVGRVVEERREDRAELRAERRIAVAHVRAERAERRAARAERRARRRAEAAEIKAARDVRPNALPVPAWLARAERPAGSAPASRIPVPRRAILAAALTVAAAVPAYSVVSGSLTADERPRIPEAAAAPADSATPAPSTGPTAVPSATGTPALPGIPAGPAATGAVPGTVPAVDPAASDPVVSGDTGEFARTLPTLPTPAPAIPAPRLRIASTPDGSIPLDSPAVVGSVTHPLTVEQAREAQRQAKWEQKMTRVPRSTGPAGK